MSTSNDRTPRLPKRAEVLLDGWPAPSRGALAWEETATDVMARVRRTEIGSTSDELLGAPLPEEPDEKGRTPAPDPSDAKAGKETSLAEIARAALSSAEAARREVARDGLIAAEQGRKNPRDAAPINPASALAAGLQGRIVRAQEPPRPPLPPLGTIDAVRAGPAFSPVVEAAAHSEMPAPLSREPRRSGPAVLGGVALAIAAGTALFIAFGARGVSEVRLTASAEAPATRAGREGTRAEVAPAPAPAAAASPESMASSSPRRLSLRDLEVPSGSPVASAPNVAVKEKTLAFRVKKEVAPNAGKLALEERDEPAPESAAPPIAQPAPPPAQGLAETPSTGAVQAAFGSVLTSARSCLAGQDTGTRATVTFSGATGRVKSVVLDGSAAGSPADSCVRAALTGARLPSFSEPTFTASVTVRPL